MTCQRCKKKRRSANWPGHTVAEDQKTSWFCFWTPQVSWKYQDGKAPFEAPLTKRVPISETIGSTSDTPRWSQEESCATREKNKEKTLTPPRLTHPHFFLIELRVGSSDLLQRTENYNGDKYVARVPHLLPSRYFKPLNSTLFLRGTKHLQR